MKTLGIKKNMLEIVQDKLQYSTICEQIHSSTGVREVCATTGPRFSFVRVDAHFSIFWRSDKTSTVLWQTTSEL